MAYDWGRGGSGALSGAAAGAQFGPWGAAAGGALGALGGFGGNPTDDAMKYYKQIPGQMKPYYDPYINAGRGALGQLNGQYGTMAGQYQGVQNQYNDLMNDPAATYNWLASGYQKSPGYDWRMKQGMAGVNNANAAGGMLGSPMHQQEASEMSQGIANQDFGNYMNQVGGMYGMGLQGNTNMMNRGLQGLDTINQMGFGASTDLATNLAQALMSQGNLQYAGQNNQNQQNSGMLGNAIGNLGNLGSLFGFGK